MRKIFADVWLKIVIIKPPWTLKDIFQCFLKHWIAVFSHTLCLKSKYLLEKLEEFFSKTQKGK